MTIERIDDPLAGERVVALSPEDASLAATDWLRRPNLFAGRALTEATLQGRQDWQAGRIAQRGQALTSGVVRGLEVAAEPLAPGVPASDARLLVEPGQGLALSGEDVLLPRRVECRLQDLPVVAPPAWFVAAGGGAGGVGDADDADGGEVATEPDGLWTRELPDDRRLADLRQSAGERLPRVGVLLLQPVTVERSSADPDDPCELCPCGEGETASDQASPVAYQDWRRTDGARLLWYPWPEEWQALPGVARQRNALAHLIFDAEARLPHGAALPWETWGVPIALIALDGEGRALWVDRAAVARQGGRAREARLQLAAGSGGSGGGAAGGLRLAASSRLPALWQARMEQFAGQLAERIDTLTPPGGEPAPAPQDLAEPFLRLPPCGLLPAGALDFGNLHANPPLPLRSAFFPPGVELDAVPVPLEQLDLAMRASAALASVDLSAPERLRLLVPVTQASWEARLLHQDVVDPEFQATLDDFLLRRARSLGQRQGLRQAQALLQRALDGREPVVPEPAADPLAVEPEGLAPWGPPPDGGGHAGALMAGEHQHYFDGASTPFIASAAESLFAWVLLDPDHPPRTLMLQWHDANGWEHRAYWGDDLVPWGRPATGSHPYQVPAHRHMGALPVPGRWQRLAVPSALVGLAGVAVDGMSFLLYDGRAAWGTAGALAGATERNWFGNVLPAGARPDGNEDWAWLSANGLWAPFDAGAGVVPGVAAQVPEGGGHLEPARAGVHQHYLEGASAGLTNIAPTDLLYAWVYLDPHQPPRELMIQWRLGNDWNQNGRRAYWGANLIGWGSDGTPSRRRIGGLPAMGQWVRLEVPASALDAVGQTINGIAFTLYDGCAAFGACGKIGQVVLGSTSVRTEQPWFSGAQPAGAALSAGWQWLGARDLNAPTPSARVGQVQALAELAADPALAVLSDQERAQLPLRGLEGFMAYLSARADRADDITDFGFTHMQVDMHRVRQMMMSTSDASRLAISPALAAIAKSDSALAVQTQIKDFLSGVKAAAKAPSPAPAPRALTLLAANLSPAISSVQSLQLSTARTQLIQKPRAPLDIVYANPVVGLAEVRTTAIADRLKQPPSTEARDYALSNRHRAVQSLLELLREFTAEDSGATPALFEGFAVFGLDGDPFLQGAAARQRPLADFMADPARLGLLLKPPPTTQRQADGSLKEVEADEATLFTQSVALSDNTIAMLRQVESRLTVYRRALTRCDAALAALRGHLQDQARRLAQADDALAEARHDVGVARALLAEETARIAAINARRLQVLREEVRYLAFVRPRETSGEIAAPRRVIDPGLQEAPVPACLREHGDVPDELDGMLQVLREAPASHFVGAPVILQRIDRPELLLRTLRSAQLRSTVVVQRGLGAVASAQAGSGALGVHIGQMLARQTQAIALRAEAVQRLDLQSLSAATWQGAQRQAQAVISLGDIIDGDHGKGDVARQASELFERIAGVCACLHAEFSGVRPSIRLDWAELMSQFDDAPDLRQLGGLPRWSEIDATDRRQMQAYADFLFGQVDPARSDAVALINDTVRMALLLASHAPVGRIIAGRLPRPVTAVRVGSHIPLLALDPERVRVGMQAMIYKGERLMARATVEDVGQGEVSARLLHTSSVQIDLDTEVRVHFDQASVLSAAPLRGARLFQR